MVNTPTALLHVALMCKRRPQSSDMVLVYTIQIHFRPQCLPVVWSHIANIALSHNDTCLKYTQNDVKYHLTLSLSLYIYIYVTHIRIYTNTCMYSYVFLFLVSGLFEALGIDFPVPLGKQRQGAWPSRTWPSGSLAASGTCSFARKKVRLRYIEGIHLN